MEIRNLNTFLQVASLRNFTKASQELGYSQSNVSAQIKQLEEEIGAPLFDRIGKRVFLTSYGEALMPYARQIVSSALQLENFLKSEETMGGILRIGVVDSLIGLLLEEALLRFHRRFPRVQVELTVDATAVLKERLRQGLLDMACLIDDPLLPADWIVRTAEEVPVVVVANPNHPLSQLGTVSLENLSEQEMILMEESAPYSVHFQNALAAKRVEPRVFLKLQSAGAALRLVEQGPFLSVLPLYTALESVRERKACILKTEDWKVSQWIQLVLHRSKIMTPQLEGLLAEIQVALSTYWGGDMAKME